MTASFPWAASLCPPLLVYVSARLADRCLFALLPRPSQPRIFSPSVSALFAFRPGPMLQSRACQLDVIWLPRGTLPDCRLGWILSLPFGLSQTHLPADFAPRGVRHFWLVERQAFRLGWASQGTWSLQGMVLTPPPVSLAKITRRQESLVCRFCQGENNGSISAGSCARGGG